MIGQGIRGVNSGLYILPSSSSDEMFTFMAKSSPDDDVILWHRHLAHINMSDLVKTHLFADGIQKLTTSKSTCRACMLGKAHKLPFHGKFNRASHLGEKVHSDIVGKMCLSFPDRYQYVCTFLDDHSRYTFLAFFHHRDEVSNAFKMVAGRFSKLKLERPSLDWAPIPISILHSDGAQEYQSITYDFGGTKTNP